MQTSDKDKLIEEITHLENLRYQYLLTEQYDKFVELCHPDLRYTHTNGLVDDFDGYTTKCLQNYYKYIQVQLDIDNITSSDTLVLVFSNLKVAFFAGSELKEFNNQILSVWVKVSEDWKFYAYQPTPII